MSESIQPSCVWAITSYFTFDDPPGKKRRLETYRKFRKRLQVPLVAVELSQDGEFDLGPEDAESLIQVEGGAMLWQKERLLNIAIDALPPECDAVAWIDCDVVLENERWPEALCEALTRYELVQPFRRIRYLDRDEEPGSPLPEGTWLRDSIAFRLEEGTIPLRTFGGKKKGGDLTEYRVAQGNIWAARRDLLDRHGLYDAFILGGADKGILAAAYGFYEEVTEVCQMSGRQIEHFLEWAVPFFRDIECRVGWIPGDAYHLWHGDMEFRGYLTRFQGFERFEFDPAVHLAMNEQAVWEWGEDHPALAQWARDHFEGRKR